ncbi:MAG: carbohydrate ABC transporter permease [Lachnospiraceae bacterium]|nr:carbohydrate ABC transporter permease [Lachnospiraceae bacterium]
MRKLFRKVPLNVIKLILALAFIIPLIVAIIVSLQSIDEVNKLPYELSVADPSLDNFNFAMSQINLLGYFKNTIIQILICVPCQIITALMAAYAFSHFNFPMKNLLFTIMIASLMIPMETVTVSLFKMMVGWDLINTYIALCITGLINVSAVFMFRQNMLSIPKSIWEAARIDGCGHIRYFVKILIPLCKPIIIAQTLLSVIWAYNDYFWPMLVTTSDSMRTIQTGVAYLKDVAHPGVMMSAVLLILVVPVILFVFGLDSITEGVTAGAVKN